MSEANAECCKMACGVCGSSVGSNSMQCTSCQKWVHNKCSDEKGSMCKVMKSFVFRGCLNPVISTGRTHTHATTLQLSGLCPGQPG